MELTKLQLHKTKDLLLLALTFLVLLFWFLSNTFDVYEYAIVGAVFEMVSLQMILLLLVIPIISMIFWAKSKWSLKTAYPICILLPIAFFVLAITNG